VVGLSRHVCFSIFVGVKFTITTLTLVSEEGGEEEGEDGGADEDDASKSKSPAERLLDRGPDELWVLKPLPESRTVRSSDLGLALHIYVTQQWSMAPFVSC